MTELFRDFEVVLASELDQLAQAERARAEARQRAQQESAIPPSVAAAVARPDAPPWSPVPIAKARDFLRLNPAAQVDFFFPTVYEENRTEKIKDLAAAQGLDVISHRRMAEQVANELGFEQYDYDEELQQIKVEKDAALLMQPGVQDLAGGGGLAPFAGPGGDTAGGNALFDAVMRHQEEPPSVPPGEGVPFDQLDAGQNKRDLRSGVDAANFRRGQRNLPSR